MTAPLVIIGGGLAAATLITELRERDDDRPIVLFTDEPHAPYERPPLSKDFLLGKKPLASALVHPEDWYAAHGVDLRIGTSVTAIDPANRTVTAGGEPTTYDTLVLATGAEPRHLAMADGSGARVHYLRSWDDAERLRDTFIEGSRLAIIGGGWIGLEVAAAARSHGVEVTVLESLELPLVRILGPEVAGLLTGLHREHGVDVRTGVTVRGITSDKGITLDLGDDAITVDTLVVGIGVQPRDGLAKDAGLTVDNGIRTDARLRTSDEHILAIGDVANADHPRLGRPLRVEHWDTAIKHGTVAARQLTGEDVEHDALPYFFTDQYDWGMEYVGHTGDGVDLTIVRGDREKRVFTAWWLKDGRVVAGMHGNHWDAIEQVRRLVGRQVDPERLADEDVALADVETLDS